MLVGLSVLGQLPRPPDTLLSAMFNRLLQEECHTRHSHVSGIGGVSVAGNFPANLSNNTRIVPHFVGISSCYFLNGGKTAEGGLTGEAKKIPGHGGGVTGGGTASRRSL